ncbi:polyprenyl synthetase family protein [Longispora fulva]|uniref:Geranylgeranyl diphosphate synthase type I n=1 Tax=Longispora fulva TaxID=619741 RepID=A0A8J7GTE2_9ACTN|nr:polyprenyl synthetase family protein [Longispora fulva]MBG6138209.1 geranylgeranyl diphosphate synthase type I [Longispora fulva]
MNHDHAPLQRRVTAALESFLTAQRERLSAIDSALLPVADALTEFVLGGGKRMRPAFAYWGFVGAGGQDTDAVVACLSSLELVQASALIHDDVMDASDTRRGLPAIHRRFADRHAAEGWAGDSEAFGRAAAILLGDLCLAWSDELFDGAGVDTVAVARARPVFDEMRTEVMAGQYLDVLAVATRDTSVERASKIAVYKSAKYTIERPILMGGALAGADDALLKCYSAYGLPLGEAFQLRDDELGVFGDPAVTGKPAGDDLREGKRTYLVAAAMAAGSPAQREVVSTLLGDPDLDDRGVAALREVIVSTGALATVEARISELTAAAHDALDGAPVEPGAHAVLTDLITAATRRAG